MEEEKIVESKFSSGLNIVRRLDSLWKKCQELKRNGRYSDWNDELDSIWLELARDLFEKKDLIEEGDEFKKIKELFDEFEEKLQEQLPFIDSATGFQQPSKDAIKKRNEQYKILMNKQLFLARLENYVGKGTTEKEMEDDWD